MNIERVRAVLESPNETTISELFQDRETVFGVSNGEEDEAIPFGCEEILQTGQLSGKTTYVDTGIGYKFAIKYGKKRVQVPVTGDKGDHHVTLCILNSLLAPDYEIRFCIDSKDNRGVSQMFFLPLTATEWEELEQQYGERVAERFYRIAEKPNLFTDPFPF